MNKITILGIGDEGPTGLTALGLDRLNAAEVVISAPATLARIDSESVTKIELRSDLDEVVDEIRDLMHKRIVILSPGDPLFFGTTRFLCESLGKDHFEVIPHVSMMQLAFARIRESWDEAFLSDLSLRTPEQLFDKIRYADKVGLFTTAEFPPSRVAQMLVEQRADYFRAFVCEDIASPKERITECTLPELCDMEFDSLNVLILLRSEGRPEIPQDDPSLRLFGNADEYFLQSQPKRGLLTPAEVRCMALGAMGLRPNSVVWDVGAGSGSVAIEAARLCQEGQVYAIEMDNDDYQLLQTNTQRFKISNVHPVHGEAPQAWRNIPDPDAIFVGGTGRFVHDISLQAFDRLGTNGRIVVHLSDMSLANRLFDSFQTAGFQPDIWMLNFARGHLQFESLRFDAVNPSFLISCVKSVSRD